MKDEHVIELNTYTCKKYLAALKDLEGVVKNNISSALNLMDCKDAEKLAHNHTTPSYITSLEAMCRIMTEHTEQVKAFYHSKVRELAEKECGK